MTHQCAGPCGCGTVALDGPVQVGPPLLPGTVLPPLLRDPGPTPAPPDVPAVDVPVAGWAGEVGRELAAWREQLDLHLAVSEIFGPTLQGEGPAAGRRAMFVRLGGCNLTCRACDTPYTWDATRYDLREQMTPRPVRDVLAFAQGAPLVVISGGEPLLHARRGLVPLVQGLVMRGQTVHFETNGTLAEPAPLADVPGLHYVVSPKLAGPMSDDAQHLRIRPDVLTGWGRLAAAGRATFKIVCAEANDLLHAGRLADDHGVPRDAVWVMPEGRDHHTVLHRARHWVDQAVGLGFNVSLRLHLALWPDEERGR